MSDDKKIEESDAQTDIYTAYSEAGTKSKNWVKWEEGQTQEYKDYRARIPSSLRYRSFKSVQSEVYFLCQDSSS